MTPVLPPVTLDELGILSRRASTVIERLRERVFAPGSQKRLDLIYNVRTAAEMVGRSEKAIRDAEDVIGVKAAVYFECRPDHRAKWTSVTIDLASA